MRFHLIQGKLSLRIMSGENQCGIVVKRMYWHQRQLDSRLSLAKETHGITLG